jgi:predicted nucleic acid-binding protein
LKVLLDTNILLDAVLDRRPHSVAAVELLSRVERKQVVGVLGATTVTTLHYLLGRAVGRDRADWAVRRFLVLCEVAPVDGAVLLQAAGSAASDFEDAVLLESGLRAGVEAIVTRDRSGFGHAEIPVLGAEEVLARLDTIQG